MSTRTVDWSTGRDPGAAGAPAEGLRERKKRRLRQQLTDTATELFLARGFEAVKVTEIAAACGVSEKTVYNYFPTKESLVLDRTAGSIADLRAGLADRSVPPVAAVLRILAGELRSMTGWLAQQDDPVRAASFLERFGQMIRTTPSLRAHQRDAMDEATALAAGALAERAGLDPDAPEPRIAATALVGLWDIQYRSLHRHLTGTRAPAQVARAVTAEVRRAARLLDTGLHSFPGGEITTVR